MTRPSFTSDWLTPKRGTTRRKKFLVCDIESKDGDTQRAGFTRPFLMGIYDGVTYNPFRSTSPRHLYWSHQGCIHYALSALFTPENSGKLIYAHNGGKFDFLFFLPWLASEGVKIGLSFEVIPVGSSIQVLDVFRMYGKRKIHRWRCLDSIKLMSPASFGTSLKEAARAFAIDCNKLEHDLDMHEDDRQWEVYNERDCVVLYKVVTKFHELVENSLGGEVGITAPSTAMKTFRKVYLKKPVPRIRSIHDFVRQAYYGGRVEAFAKTGENLRYYDFNSSYPAAMLEPVPCGTATIWQGNPPLNFVQLVERNLMTGFAECDIEIPEHVNIPPLPVRHDDKLCFPVGKLRGTWDYLEIQAAIECGATVHRWGQSVWISSEPILAEMVRDLFRYRNKDAANYNEGLAKVAKDMLNSLYGKFGMNPLRRKIYFASDDVEIPQGAKPATGDIDSLIWYADEESDQAYIIPHIAAHITTLARLRLWYAMRAVEAQGKRVYYCDTDSIITDAILPSSNTLGELKDEYPGHAFTGLFAAPKVYLLRDGEFRKHRAKGLERASYEDVEAYAQGKTFHTRRLEKLGTLARANFSRGPVMVEVPRTLRASAQKRNFAEDGTSRPLVINHWSTCGEQSASRARPETSFSKRSGS